MLFFSKPQASMSFKAGLFSKFAVNAVASPTLPFLPQRPDRFGGLFSGYWRERTRLHMRYKSCGPEFSSPSEFSTISGTSWNCLPPSGSSKSSPSSLPLDILPLKQLTPPRETKLIYTNDVLPPRIKSMSDVDTSKVRCMFANRHTLLSPVKFRLLRCRDLHNSCILLRNSKSNFGKDCKSIKDICKSKKDVCSDTESCKENKDITECYSKGNKCEPKKTFREDKVEEKQVCPKSCVRGGKCIIAASKKPAKMVYGSTECPPPKLISPRTCPRSSSNDYANDEPVCTEKVAARKLRKDVCVPPPLPGPPTDPVPLCPCPPPPKLHPGPCPCAVFKEEIKIKSSAPCPTKDKYPCCFPNYYCPPKKPCVRKLPCDQTKKTKI